MSNPIFLDVEQVLSILMGEMPRGVYAEDRADSPNNAKRSYSSSEIRAHAQVYADLYTNLQDIYQNKFISTVQPDEINRWEFDLFSTPQNSSNPFSVRQANLITKWRARGGISYAYIDNLVSSILTPVGLTYTINVFCGMPQGAWILDVSPLDFDTYLGEMDPLLGAVVGQYDLDCNFAINTLGITTASSPTVSGFPNGLTDRVQIGAGISGAGIPSGTTILSKGSHTVTMSHNATVSASTVTIQIQNYIAAGLTLAQLQSIQATAYTYAVYIYGNADGMTLSALDQVLTQSEPGGSTHLIFNNAVPPIDPDILDLGGGSECVLVDAYDCGNGTLATTYNIWDFSL